MIYAKILADSVNIVGNRLTTMEIEYPLYIHNEIMTHRTFSRNSASSRAIPVAKRLQRVCDDPVIPTVWPKNEPGMSASVNLSGDEAARCSEAWKDAANEAVKSARTLAELGVHKQIANRIVEPWCWMKTIVSATEWENFFALRCAKDAHPDLQELAFKMLEAMCNSTPVNLWSGEWHLPFGDKMDSSMTVMAKARISTARCARVSYLTQDGVLNFEADFELHDRLLKSKHMSPFEHCAEAMRIPQFVGNFKGFCQYRKMIEGETLSCNLMDLYNQLLSARNPA